MLMFSHYIIFLVNFLHFFHLGSSFDLDGDFHISGTNISYFSLTAQTIAYFRTDFFASFITAIIAASISLGVEFGRSFNDALVFGSKPCFFGQNSVAFYPAGILALADH